MGDSEIQVAPRIAGFAFNVNLEGLFGLRVIALLDQFPRLGYIIRGRGPFGRRRQKL
jgi:hypothetical protein